MFTNSLCCLINVPIIVVYYRLALLILTFFPNSSLIMDTKENNEHQNTNVSHNHEEFKPENKNTLNSVDEARKNVNRVLIICILGILMAVVVEKFNNLNITTDYEDGSDNVRPKYLAHSKGGQHLIKHVHNVLRRLGFQQASENATDWDLLWSREYPFLSSFAHTLHDLKEHQRVNHLPGVGYLTQKDVLSVTNNKHIPRSFQLPKSKEEFLAYAEKNKDAVFVQKLNSHRGVQLKNASDMDLSGKSFAQEFVQNPLLIDGHKFDIGIYMVVTSVNPLRIYWYKEDVLLRFCPEKYHPLDPKKFEKYVIDDDYKPTWDIPSLAYSFNGLGLGMKGSLDSYLRTKDINPEIVWDKVTSAIADIFLMQEIHLIDAIRSRSSSPNSYFEMMRVDLILDEDLNVYLIEANMSPNLVADTKPTNQLLYEQVLYNTFSITGIASRYQSKHDPSTFTMISAPKNIATWGKDCTLYCIEKCDYSLFCGTCATCRGPAITATLQATHRENLHKGALRRLFPPKLKPGTSYEEVMPKIKDLRESNQLLYLWYQGKCNDDITWCA